MARFLSAQATGTDADWSPDPLLLHAALEGLRPSDREVLYLRWELELTTEEIADLLGISAAAAQRRAHRALDRLRRALTEAEQKRA